MLFLLLSCPFMSESLRPHGLQHIKPPCPSTSLKVCPSSCPLHWWCHLAISSSDILFSVFPQSFPASGTFPVSRLFTSDEQNTAVSTSASVLPMSIHGWFPLRLTDLISLLSKGLLGVFSSTSLKASILQCSAFFTVQLSQLYVTTGKSIALTPSWLIALSWRRGLRNSIKLWPVPCRATQDRWVTAEFWRNVIHWRRDWQAAPVCLLWEPHELYKRNHLLSPTI